MIRFRSNADAFAEQIADFPAKFRRKLGPRLRKAAERVAIQARMNASWSTRIPGAIRVKAGARGVQIIADQGAAPHARLYEFGHDRRGFRHPVFGRDVWVQQATRPFIVPALRQHGPATVQEIQEAIEDAWREIG